MKKQRTKNNFLSFFSTGCLPSKTLDSDANFFSRVNKRNAFYFATPLTTKKYFFLQDGYNKFSVKSISRKFS